MMTLKWKGMKIELENTNYSRIGKQECEHAY